ncbi:MAG TPA: NAD(P)-dependent oxidoreductase [Rhizobiales bacterium]|nr:NAD(P)-dependent oxidoreductase [Hyphomicrobiales bacterium]
MREEDVQKQLKIGVAGCGRMGLPMAKAIKAGGFDVKGFDIRPNSEFGEFAPSMIEDINSLAAHSDVVLSIVRDITETDALLFDEQALLSQDQLPKILIICSTLSPKYIKGLRERVPKSVTLIDAPMSGAVIAAEEARLSFMLGGEDETLDALTPLFQTMGSKLHRMGDYGAGMTAKVLNNFIAATSTVAVRQVLDWADELEVDHDKLLSLMHDSSGQTWLGSHFHDIEFAVCGFEPDNTIGILKKDVESALDAVSASPDEGLQQAIIQSILVLKPYRSSQDN